MIDENEQLRTALESALDENNRLVEDRDRLLRRVSLLSREMQAAHDARPPMPPELPAEAESQERQRQTEEELRVALEELQVLTEELEVANTSLHQTNRELDGRVAERTRQISDINSALRTTEGSLRTIADLVPGLLWRADAQGFANWFNRRWSVFTGHETHQPGKGEWLDAVHPDDRQEARQAWFSAINSGSAFRRELRICDHQGQDRWFLVRAEPMRSAGARILNWFAVATDIHEQRAALEALAKSEIRFRTLVEGMPQLVWRAHDGGRWTWASPQWTAYTGQSDTDCRETGWLAMLLPDDREQAMTAWAGASDAGVLEMEGRIFHADERRYRHFRTRAQPVRDAQGGIVEWLGTSTDVDDLVQLQQQQSVLVAELQHRTRNLMAVVQAVTLRTIRDSGSLEEFRLCIEDRLQTLARVQGLLSRRKPGERISFDLLLREELSAHIDIDENGMGRNVVMNGPTGIPLRSSIIQTLALALHELVTNALKYGALKYGALSQADAQLRIEWSVGPGPKGERVLAIDWRETGVTHMPDEAGNPRGGGYGRELIERALPYQLGARTSYGFERDGVHCTIAVDVPSDDEMQEKQGG